MCIDLKIDRMFKNLKEFFENLKILASSLLQKKFEIRNSNNSVFMKF